MSLRQPKRRLFAVLPLLLAATLALGTRGGEPTESPGGTIETDRAAIVQGAERNGGEVLHMRWKLTGFLGLLAGLFVPNSGEGLLTIAPQAEQHTRVQFLVTAPSREDDYFLYGADINDGSGSTDRVWSSYSFRGERKDEGQAVDAPDVIDFASAIHHLRHDPPTGIRRMTVWSGGRTYPVEIEPLAPRMRKIAGQKMDVRGYVVRGVKIKGQPTFDDKFFVYFADDERSTPVEILGKRGLVRIRFELTDAG